MKTEEKNLYTPSIYDLNLRKCLFFLWGFLVMGFATVYMVALYFVLSVFFFLSLCFSMLTNLSEPANHQAVSPWIKFWYIINRKPVPKKERKGLAKGWGSERLRWL